MRFHPTRLLCQQLHANPHILSRYTVRIRPRVLFNRRYGLTLSVLHKPARRSFFGPFSKKPAKEVKGPDLAPGMLLMIQLSTTIAVRARPPPADELLKAFTNFFDSRAATKQPVTYIEADHSLRTFRHLREMIKDDAHFGITDKYILLVMKSLATLNINFFQKLPAADELALHNAFAKELWGEIQRRRRKKLGTTTEEEPKIAEIEFHYHVDTAPYLAQLAQVLIYSGGIAEAKLLAEKIWDSRPRTSSEFLTTKQELFAVKIWHKVMLQFAREEEGEEGLLQLIRQLEIYGVPFTPKMRSIMVIFYAHRDNILAAKAWYERQLTWFESSKHRKRLKQPLTTYQMYYEILQTCLRNNEKDWATTVFRELVDSNPVKDLWDIIFLWAASGLGKGTEELDRMMTIMVQRNPESQDHRPNVETINRLVKTANMRGDHYAAERYIELGKKWSVKPNAETFALQMDYRISAGDLTGAEVSYNSLRDEGSTLEDVPVINKFIQALCAAQTVKYDLINEIVAELEERKQRLSGDTVKALCLMNLERNELLDVVNILSTHCYHHSLDERAKTREALAGFCFDRENSTQRIWDAYNILRELFDEISVEIRTQMMNELFDRQRPDLAIHVFGHMRQHERLGHRPKLETYVAAFSAFARPGCADVHCVSEIRHMLKLDSNIEPNTRLHNSLMLAYIAIGEPRAAMEFWEDITNSIEGPSYTSIELVFRACEILPFGAEPAQSVWTKMRKMEIEVTPAVYTAYIGALAGQGLLTEAMDLIEGMEADVGYGPDMMTLATLYNAIKGQSKRDTAEQWAKELYPQLWKEVEALGQKLQPQGHRLFKLERPIKV